MSISGGGRKGRNEVIHSFTTPDTLVCPDQIWTYTAIKDDEIIDNVYSWQECGKYIQDVVVRCFAQRSEMFWSEIPVLLIIFQDCVVFTLTLVNPGDTVDPSPGHLAIQTWIVRSADVG